MLNYKLKVIDARGPGVRRACKRKSFKGWAVVKLMSEIWELKKAMTSLKLRAVYMDFEEMLRGEKKRIREEIKLKVMEYLLENTDMDKKTWRKAEELLVEEGVFKKGGLMNIREYIKEKGRWEGRQEGLQKGRQEGEQAGLQKGRQEGQQAGLQKGRLEKQQQIVLNMLKSKLDVSLISEVTGLSEKEIKKLKNGS